MRKALHIGCESRYAYEYEFEDGLRSKAKGASRDAAIEHSVQNTLCTVYVHTLWSVIVIVDRGLLGRLLSRKLHHWQVLQQDEIDARREGLGRCYVLEPLL